MKFTHCPLKICTFFTLQYQKLYKIFEITHDMSSPTEILPNVEIIYTSAACDACDKYHVCLGENMSWDSAFLAALAALF